MKACVISQGTPELSVQAESIAEAGALADFVSALPAASLVLCDVRVGTILFDKAALKKFAAVSTLAAEPVEAAA